MLIRDVTFGVPLAEIFSAVDERPHSFLLESGLPLGASGRYSFLGFEPRAIFRVRGGCATFERDGQLETLADDPLIALRRVLLRRDRPRPPSDWPFTGGAVGWFAYEFGARFERIESTRPDDLAIPEVEFGFYDVVLASDRVSARTVVIANPENPAESAALADRFEETIRRSLADAGHRPSSPRQPASSSPRSNFQRGNYLTAIERIREYIAAGDVYQANLSQRFETPLDGATSREVYRRLREESPAPFACCLQFGSVGVAGCSPERFLRLRGNRAETRPIKGTRRRGRDVAEDAALARELQASEKDQAELLMIVDLERNDLGRLCVPGSIVVEERARLETHPTVHHLVAEISGRLTPGLDVCDCLRAMLPGGSITGAPKIRAMQIIRELEPHRRHLYTGAIGWIGYDGDCDLNVAIRTITCINGRAYYHVGSGIVADSEPRAEFDETLAKGRALWRALCNQPAP
jgi:para-aminobenzoate synthetase component I